MAHGHGCVAAIKSPSVIAPTLLLDFFHNLGANLTFQIWLHHVEGTTEASAIIIMASWIPQWLAWWDKGPVKPMRPTDAMHHPIVRAKFDHFMANTDPPATFRAQHVAEEIEYNELLKLGYERWQDVMPAVIELAFEMRAMGNCDLIKQGKVLGEDVSAYDIEGGLRIRRRDD